MKTKVDIIVQSIEQKRLELKRNVETFFSTISVQQPISFTSSKPNKGKKIPPISYILYGLAGVSAIGIISGDSGISKLLCLGVSAASAYGGYKLSNPTMENTVSVNNVFNIDTLKNEIKSKIVDSIKSITKDWEDFMEIQQKKLQNSIQNSEYSEQEKDAMLSKVYVYEVIDVSLSEVNRMISDATDSEYLKRQLQLIKTRIINAIDQSLNQQINKYQSVCN